MVWRMQRQGQVVELERKGYAGHVCCSGRQREYLWPLASIPGSTSLLAPLCSAIISPSRGHAPALRGARRRALVRRQRVAARRSVNSVERGCAQLKLDRYRRVTAHWVLKNGLHRRKIRVWRVETDAARERLARCLDRKLPHSLSNNVLGRKNQSSIRIPSFEAIEYFTHFRHQELVCVFCGLPYVVNCSSLEVQIVDELSVRLADGGEKRVKRPRRS